MGRKEIPFRGFSKQQVIRLSRTFEVSYVIRSRDTRTAVLEDQQSNTCPPSSKGVSDEISADCAQNLDVSISSLSCPIVTTRPLSIHLGGLPSVSKTIVNAISEEDVPWCVAVDETPTMPPVLVAGFI